jgi:hypothetical protein
MAMDETHEAPALTGTFIFSGEAPPKRGNLSALQPAALYMEQFNRVSDFLRRRRKTVLVWDDMFARYPELIPQIPAGTIMAPWGYDRTVYEPY